MLLADTVLQGRTPDRCNDAQWKCFPAPVHKQHTAVNTVEEQLLSARNKQLMNEKDRQSLLNQSSSCGCRMSLSFMCPNPQPEQFYNCKIIKDNETLFIHIYNIYLSF